MDKTMIKSDAARLAIGGGALLLLAAVFLWQDLHLPLAYTVVLLSVLGFALSFLRGPRLFSQAGLLLLLLCAVGGGAWFALTKSVALLPALGLTFGFALSNVVLAYPRARLLGDLQRVRQIWYVFAAAALSASWAFYFRFLTMGIAEDNLLRRLLLTLFWAGVGVALVVTGQRRRENAMREAGLLFVVIAVAKALCYDTTHLYGGLRIATLMGAGLLLLGGAFLSSRPAAKESH
jgi:uncharacterized membrane protein